MKTRLLNARSILLLFFFMLQIAVMAQTATVFTDGFAISAGTTYTTAPGPIGTSTVWNMSRSGADFGARITGGNMVISNDASGAGNAVGWVLASTSASNFIAPYNTTLASNPGMVTWTFNMRQSRSNPGGFAANTYGEAFILAGTLGTNNATGTGYAVTLGNSGKIDPIRLVRYNAGLSSSTSLLQSSTTGLTDFGNQYLGVKVTYTPGTNTWQLFVRNDGVVFTDPNTGTLTSQGTVVNNTYTATALPIMGGFWNALANNNQSAIFDNIKVIVAVPVITSLAPPSKVAGTGAFTLTVNGLNFISGTSTVNWNGSPRATTFVSATQLTAAITAGDIITAGTAAITVANGTAISNSVNFIIDPAGVPSISVSTSSLNAFTTITGTASAAQTYTVSGVNLTNDVIVTAPANFELSANGTNYFDSLTLLRTGSVLVGQPVTVFARVKSAAPAGLYSGTIDHTSTGATIKQIAVSATVIAAQPTTQASGVTFTTVTSESFTVNWVNGNGSNRIVLIRPAAAVNSNPVDGTSYFASTAYGNGSLLGTNNYVVFNGTGNAVTVTGLTPNSLYHVAVYEFNGAGTTENYNTISPATGNRTTLNAPIGWQIYTANAVNTINFDATVDGVNSDIFQGDGIADLPTVGQLNSNAWAISGFSDGAIGFAGTYIEGTDFDRGFSDVPVAIGGVYAFDTATNNFSLGIQPATGDFAPGTVTLRFQNQTGAAVTSINVGYKVYVYNDKPASSSFNFSHATTENGTYATVTGLDVTSPATADLAPGWKAYYRVVTLTGLNIATNNYYYLRWSGATVSGTTDFDEFGLDDIVMVANPTTTFVPFSGTAENFAVLGNATLSGDTAVSSDITFNGGKLGIASGTLALNGTITNTTAQGIKGSATGSLTIGGAVNTSLSFDQTTLGSTNLLNNFSVNTTAANTTTILNPVVVDGALFTAAGQTVNFGTNALAGILASITNNGTIQTQNTTALPFPSGKTWGGTGVVHYNAASAQQTIVTGTYNGLTISTTGGGIAAGSFAVNGILNLPSANPSATVGGLSMETFTLTMGGSAVNVGTGEVTGIITRNAIAFNTLYTFGHASTSIIFPIAGTLPTSMSLKVVIGATPSWRPGGIKRNFDFIQSGAANTKAVLKAHYLDSELNGNIEIKLVDWAHIYSSNTTLEQGRSNYNTTENWVELTNANIGLYFAPVFNQVNIALDESEAGSLTWNGSISDSWTTAANWTPNATPSDATIVYIPNAATTPNDPTLNPAVLLGALNIDAGGILNPGTNTSFTINNGAGAWINYGIFNPGATNVFFTNADATIAGSTPFNNVTINSGAGLRPLTGNIMNITGSFTNNGSFYPGAIDNTVIYSGINQTIAVPFGGMLAYYNLTISGTGAVFPSSLNVVGNLTLNQSVDFTGKSISMTGSVLQTIGGTSSPTFNNLIINNSFGQVAMLNSETINGTLTLTAGNLNIGNNILTLGVAPVAGTFNASRMIIANGTGEVRRPFTGTGSYTFPIGDNTGTLEYSPITVFMNSGAFSSAYIGVSVIDAIHPNNYSIDNNISRYWKVNQSGITGAVATITATYTLADIMGTESDIAAAQLNGTFNQQSNPWIRYSALGSNTLSASAVNLTAGQTAAFTGIKGETFSVVLTGYGSFCLNQSATLTAEINGGDSPYTYFWSGGLGTAQTATPPTSSVGTVNYTVTVKDANGITATDNNNVTVLPNSVGGTVASNQTICTGSTPANLNLSGHTGNVIYWQSAPDLNFTTPVNISNTTTTLTGASIGPLTATTYYRAVVQSGACATANSAAIVITVTPQTTPSFTQIPPFCQGTTAPVLPTTSNNGITGTWNPPAVSNTASGTYLFTPNANQCATTASMSVTVDAATVGGTVSSNQTICSGISPANLTLSGNNSPVVKWQKSADAGFSSPIDIAVTSTTLAGSTIGNLTSTTYFRAMVQNSCGSSFSSAVTITVNPNVTPTFTAIPAFCQGSTAPTLPATSNNGITGTWDPATVSNLTSGTYTFTPNGGQCATTASLSVTVDPTSVGGTASSNQTICTGTMPLDLTLTGNTGSVIKWQQASDAAFTTPTDIAVSSTTLTGATIGNVINTIYLRAVVQNASCGVAYSNTVVITVKSTTWNGTLWSNGAPDSVTTAFITGDYTASANFNACTLTVSNNAVVNILSGFNVTLNGQIIVESGSFTLQNNANLLQVTNASNTGNIIVKRNSSALLRQDYTLWSAPVSGQNMLAFSPLTVVTPTSRFYTYNTITNLYNSITAPSSASFNSMNGYLIRMPNNHPSVTPTIWTGTFTGVPNNGAMTYTLTDGGSGMRFNLVGNPYPSPMDAATFTANNAGSITGALYFWRKTNNALSPSYCSWTANGGFVSNGEAQVFDPNGIIQTGQGFFVEVKGFSNVLAFNNGQRIGNNAGQFFRAQVVAQNRIWLNATNATGAFSQTLVGYISGSTLGVDQDIDGKHINDGSIALTSLIDNTDYAIQGRPLPFDPSDIVPLKFKATTAGSYTIAIDHLDGFFAETQNIFLRDNLTGAIHDLKASAYPFACEAGTFATRFEIIYQQPLATANPDFNENAVVVYHQGENVVINSGSATMNHVAIYDIRGRLIAEKSAINNHEVSVYVGQTNQVLIVKITSVDGYVITKKTIN